MKKPRDGADEVHYDTLSNFNKGPTLNGKPIEMGRAKHTPGPWSKPFVWNANKPGILTIGGKVTSQGGDFDHIVDIDVSGSAEQMANARLIAVAPEMLSLLSHLCSEITSTEHEAILFEARAVIAKARGDM